MAVNKNQLAGQRGKDRFKPDGDCLPKYNYSNGAGWRTKKPGKIYWGIKRKKNR
jgi:hypothetical protein